MKKRPACIFASSIGRVLCICIGSRPHRAHFHRFRRRGSLCRLQVIGEAALLFNVGGDHAGANPCGILADSSPFCHSTATTSSGLRLGITPTNHTFGRCQVGFGYLSADGPITCAVPVLPAKSMPARSSAPAVW